MADEVTDQSETTQAAEAAAATNTGTLSAEEQSRIFEAEFEKITTPDPVVKIDEATGKFPADDGERPRGSDGKFLPKDGEPEAKVVVEKPAEKPVTATEQTTAVGSATGPMFDVDAIITSVTNEIEAMEFDDVPDAEGNAVKTTGAKALKEYGQIADPIMARQDKMIRAVVEKMTEMIRPALEIAQARQAETAQTAVQSTVDALEADGVSDAAQLIADPRMVEFANKNPHYAALLIADPDRIEDIKFVMSKFRAANGIAAPTGEKKITGAPVHRPRQNNALQAAASTSRGNGSAKDEGGSISGTPEQIMRAEFARLERLEQQAGVPQRI